MKRKRCSEEQIIGVLKEHEAGVKTGDLCRKHGISEATFYIWKSKYGGLDVSEAKWSRALELTAGSAPWPLAAEQTMQFNRQPPLPIG